MTFCRGWFGHSDLCKDRFGSKLAKERYLYGGKQQGGCGKVRPLCAPVSGGPHSRKICILHPSVVLGPSDRPVRSIGIGVGGEVSVTQFAGHDSLKWLVVLLLGTAASAFGTLATNGVTVQRPHNSIRLWSECLANQQLTY